MRRKILLAGGIYPFEGPPIFLEPGTWLVEPPTLGKALLVLDDGEVIEFNGEPKKLTGPTRVRAIIEESEDNVEVHLDAVQVKNASVR